MDLLKRWRKERKGRKQERLKKRLRELNREHTRVTEGLLEWCRLSGENKEAQTAEDVDYYDTNIYVLTRRREKLERQRMEVGKKLGWRELETRIFR